MPIAMSAYLLDLQVILPKRNTLVQFRGDSFHGVSSHNTSTNDPRVSLVFEQFKVALPIYHHAQASLQSLRSKLSYAIACILVPLRQTPSCISIALVIERVL